MNVYMIIAFGSSTDKGFREGVAIAENEDAAIELCNDPSAIAFPITNSQCAYDAPSFEWSRHAA